MRTTRAAETSLSSFGARHDCVRHSFIQTGGKLEKYWLQILGAIIAGSVCSVAVVYLIANALHLDGAVMKSMLPQAATTAIALPLSKGIGGIQDITAFASSLTQ